MIEKIQQAVIFLKEKGITAPETGIILGTGLGQMVNEIQIECAIPYEDIPHFPISTVESHHGKLIYGTIGTRKVLAMQGRFHFYEGYSLAEVTFPVRVMKFLGIKQLLLSNAAGALNPLFKKGDLMLLDDHINFIPDNPLRGKNHDSLGPRFPDMSCPYSSELNGRLHKAANKLGYQLKRECMWRLWGPTSKPGQNTACSGALPMQ